MDCPYHTLPKSSWWSHSVSNVPTGSLNPHIESALKIDRQTRIASAGSCFAQHISRALVSRGYHYLVTEPAPDFFSAEQATRYNYGIFSARYGNIYTTVQLLQLLKRALGSFIPRDQFWTNAEGRCFDLLRPRIVPSGFSSQREAMDDDRRHLAAVKRMIEEADVFVFTLGLTEGWYSTEDGTAYPTCPGCGSAGDFSAESYIYRNLGVPEVCSSLQEAIDLLVSVNPAIKVILTVSPVPLVATMEERHVMQATVYSKSVLRVAAEEMVRNNGNVHYFASYELVTAAQNAGHFYEADRRSVSADGVSRAMDMFFEHFTDLSASPVAAGTEQILAPSDPVNSRVDKVVCDEEEFYRAAAAARQREGGSA